MSKTLLVTGATGKQGGALIDALVGNEQAKSQFEILAVTRDPNSKSAKSLAAKSPAIKVIQGNFDDVPALFRTAKEVTSQPVWGVFSVQVPGGSGQSPASEERYGKAMVDESIKQGVKHFVQTSVDRGGDDTSWANPTWVPHFMSKHNIELHLRDQTASGGPGQGMTWTILRPTAFMDNFAPGFGMKVFFAALRDRLGQKPLQVVSVADVGKLGAQAFINADKQDFKNKAIGVAGDELTFEQFSQIFANKTDQQSIATFGFLGSALLWGVKEVGLMVDWFAKEGYGVDIQRTRKLLPPLMDFETWLAERSKFNKK